MLRYGQSGAVAYTTQKPEPERRIYAKARGAVGGVVSFFCWSIIGPLPPRPRTSAAAARLAAVADPREAEATAHDNRAASRKGAAAPHGERPCTEPSLLPFLLFPLTAPLLLCRTLQLLQRGPLP